MCKNLKFSIHFVNVKIMKNFLKKHIFFIDNQNIFYYNLMVTLLAYIRGYGGMADAQDSDSCVHKTYRFKSCYPHHVKCFAIMAELADAYVWGAYGCTIRVQVPVIAPKNRQVFLVDFSFFEFLLKSFYYKKTHL